MTCMCLAYTKQLCGSTLLVRHRAAEDYNSAHELIARAIEKYPSIPEFRAIEDGYPEDKAIYWFESLCPRQKSLQRKMH